MSWSTQFGPEFAVPSEFTQNTNLVDISWGNDAAPSFTTKRLQAFWELHDAGIAGWDYLPCIFVHPEKVEDREFPNGKRFMVMAQDGGNICETDDALEAIERLVEHSNTQLLEFKQPETPEPVKQKSTLETLKDLLVENGVECRWDDERTIFIPLDRGGDPDEPARHLEISTTSGPIYWMSFYYGKNLQGRVIGQSCATPLGLLVEVYFSAMSDYAITLPRRQAVKPAVSKGPRFVLVIGAIREQFPDIPESGELCLWDRQENKPVITINPEYGNAICLETLPHGQPFTAMEEWFNGLSNQSLESEGIPATKEDYRA